MFYIQHKATNVNKQEKTKHNEPNKLHGGM